MAKKLIITDNVISIENNLNNGEIFWMFSYLCIKSTSLKQLSNIEKIFIELKFNTKLENMEHCLKIPYQLNLNNYTIYIKSKIPWNYYSRGFLIL